MGRSEGFKINGEQLTCLICKNDGFWQKEAQLNTAVASFFNLDWTNPSAICYVCDNCGHIHWFLPLEK